MNDICEEAFAAYKNAHKAESQMDGKGLAVPERWLHCPKISSLIADTFIVCKTMLDRRYDGLVSQELRFNWEILTSSVQAKYRRKIGMVIDLTNTGRFYDKREIEKSGCRHVKISCVGHGECPTEESVEQFKKVVQTFTSNSNQIVCVHCTHGFNRSGFMIASFLVDEYKYDVETAIKTFADARSPGIYKEHYIEELVRRCKLPDEDVTIEPPELPDWHKGFDDSREGNKRRRNNPKLKETRFMDGMISNVDNVTNVLLFREIQNIVSGMCEWKGKGFPGSQPVSMDRQNVNKLTMSNYGVTWKADGQRYLMFIKGRDEIFMLDRDFAVYRVNDMIFPRRKALNEHLTDTLLDGEMIIDNYQGVKRGRYLVYDIIRFEGQEVWKTVFNTRLICISKEIVEPRNELFRRGGLDKNREPFSIRAKEFWDLTKARKILDGDFSKQLLHEIDGLIFQPFDDKYEFGQCKNILKWKPPELNSIDFRLIIEEKKEEGCLKELVGRLHVGGQNPPFSFIKVTNQLKPYNNKIIECCYDYAKKGWKFMRERTDKSFPNKYETAASILESISKPVTKEMLYYIIDNKRFDLVRMRLKNEAGNGPHHPQNGTVCLPSGELPVSSSSRGSSASLKRPRDDDPLGLCSDLPPETEVVPQFHERNSIPVNNHVAFQRPNHYADPLGLQSLDETHHRQQSKKPKWD